MEQKRTCPACGSSDYLHQGPSTITTGHKKSIEYVDRNIAAQWSKEGK